MDLPVQIDCDFKKNNRSKSERKQLCDTANKSEPEALACRFLLACKKRLARQAFANLRSRLNGVEIASSGIS